MASKYLSFFLLLFVVSCGVVKKKTTYGNERKITVEASGDVVPDSQKIHSKNSLDKLPAKADAIIGTALLFSGVRYKFGGTTRSGMDCSGLVYTTFLEHNLALPRSSFEMAEEGKLIKVNDVTKGDLLFFKTAKGKRINHVGLVVAVEGDDIKFIHSTSSRGVIVSSLREGFWNYAFVKATRVL